MLNKNPKQKESLEVNVAPQKQRYIFDAKVHDLGSAIKIMDTKIATLDDTQYSYRIINHWESVGLLDNRRKNSKWRRFSLSDLFWIHIIGELRDFGFPLEKIKKVQKNLFSINGNHPHRYTQLDISIIRLLLEKTNSFFLITSNGEIDIHTTVFPKQEEWADNSFIVLSLDTIFARILKNKTIASIYNNEDFTEKEIELLLVIREGEFENITVHIKHGDIRRYDGVRTLASREKILEQIKDLLNNNSYQEVIIQQQDGQIVSVKNKVKKKFMP